MWRSIKLTELYGFYAAIYVCTARTSYLVRKWIEIIRIKILTPRGVGRRRRRRCHRLEHVAPARQVRIQNHHLLYILSVLFCFSDGAHFPGNRETHFSSERESKNFIARKIIHFFLSFFPHFESLSTLCSISRQICYWTTYILYIYVCVCYS